jgi:hypothetical protein
VGVGGFGRGSAPLPDGFATVGPRSGGAKYKVLPCDCSQKGKFFEFELDRIES